MGVSSLDDLRACLSTLGVDAEVVTDVSEGGDDQPAPVYRREPRSIEEIVDLARGLSLSSRESRFAAAVSSQFEAATRVEACLHDQVARLIW